MGGHALLRGNLPNPGIKPGSPALQAGGPSEPPGKPSTVKTKKRNHSQEADSIGEHRGPLFLTFQNHSSLGFLSHLLNFLSSTSHSILPSPISLSLSLLYLSLHCPRSTHFASLLIHPLGPQPQHVMENEELVRGTTGRKSLARDDHKPLTLAALGHRSLQNSKTLSHTQWGGRGGCF